MNKPPKITNEFIRTRKEAIKKMEKIQGIDQEAFMLVTLDPAYRIIKERVVSLGGFYINHVPLGVLFQRILEDKARYFIVGHNHPNGVGLPSIDDIMVMYKILYICECMGVDLVDSIIFPYGKKPVCLRSKYPNVFNEVLSEKVDEVFDNLVPRKLK
jgi:DNA repair protein RadC